MVSSQDAVRLAERAPSSGSCSDATPSPVPHPIAASTPAYPQSIANGYATGVKEKVSEALHRRGRAHPLKGAISGAGPSRDALPLSANVQSSKFIG